MENKYVKEIKESIPTENITHKTNKLEISYTMFSSIEFETTKYVPTCKR